MKECVTLIERRMSSVVFMSTGLDFKEGDRRGNCDREFDGKKNLTEVNTFLKT